MLHLARRAGRERPRVVAQRRDQARLARRGWSGREPSDFEPDAPPPSVFAHRRRMPVWPTLGARPGPLLISFAITVFWFLANVRRMSPLDILPFAWTWLTLWLVFSTGLELWRRYGRSVLGQRPRA
jgi:hypothetical protein